MTLFALLCIISLASTSRGQEFSIPSAWRKPSISVPRMEIEGMAHDIVDTLSPLFNSGGFISSLNATTDQHSYTLFGISRTDYLSRNETFKALVLASMDEFFPSAYYEEILEAYGLAAVSAYIAYGNSTSLNYATHTWDIIMPYQIQHDTAAGGFASVINMTIPSTCNDSTTEGGVFAFPVKSGYPDASKYPTQIDGETTAAFAALSGHLYEITNDTKYLDAATSAAEFLVSHMYTPPTMMERLNLADCQEIPQSPFTYITGFNIWGLSILATHNSTWTPFLNNLIQSSVSYAGWTNQDGIVIEGVADVAVDNMQQTFKVIWIRSLCEAWTRMDPTTSAAKYLKAYFYVQFNALRDLAYNSDVDAYSPNWAGPSVTQRYPWGQLAALDLLNTAFFVTSDSGPATSSSEATGPPSASASTATNILGPNSTKQPSAHSSTPSKSSKSSKSSKAAIAAGTTVAGMAVVAVCCLTLLIARRKRARLTLRIAAPQEGAAQPYIVAPTETEGQPRLKTGIFGSARLRVDPEATTASPATGIHARLDPSSRRGARAGAVDSNLDIVTMSQMMAEMRRMLAAIPVSDLEQVNEPPPQYYSASSSRMGTTSDEPPPQYASREGDSRVVGMAFREYGESE